MLVGSRVRATVQVDAVDDIAQGVQMTLTVTVHVVDATKPACVATVLLRLHL